MTFTAHLHIQGVGCYKELDGDLRQLLVVFPDGQSGADLPRDLCVHYNYVQFSAKHLPGYTGGFGDHYTTAFMDRELLTVDTGDDAGIKKLNVGHIPRIEDALPEPSHAHLRPIDPVLLEPAAVDPQDRVTGKLLIESGEVHAHVDGNRYSTEWFFHDKNKKKRYSSVTTVDYKDIHKFDLRFRRLGTDDVRTIPLTPNEQGILEVWVRNWCEILPEPIAVSSGFVKESGNQDSDFVLNYKVRGGLNQVMDVFDNESLPIPKHSGNVSTETRKCMGSI